MQNSVAANEPAQQLLQQVQDVSYQSVCKPGSTRQYNQHNHVDLCTLLESPPHILELQDVICNVQYFCPSETWFISWFSRAGTPEIAVSDSVESCKSKILEKLELSLGQCYRDHYLYIGPWCYENQAWSLHWHGYILPCNHVPDAQPM